MSRPGASGREEGTPCRSRTFCLGHGSPYPWQVVLWAKRGDIRSVMIGWEGFVGLAVLGKFGRAAPHLGSQRMSVVGLEPKLESHLR